VFIIFYLTYTFDPISIKFIQPFLDDYNTGSTQAKEKSRKAGPTFPGMMELCNVLLVNIKEYSEN
jgi:hypothetical protein